MIKKLLFLYLFTGLIGVADSFGQASCSPNLTCLGGASEGICPDSAAGFPAGVLNVPYSTVMSVRIPGSFTFGTSTFTLTHFAVTNVEIDTTTGGSGTYHPLTVIGLDYMGNGANAPSGAPGINGYTMTKYCYWNAPGEICVVVSGTPNKAGTFPVKISSSGRVDAGFASDWIANTDNNDYRVAIAATAGISGTDIIKFEMKQNNPNPFSTRSEIPYTSTNNNDVEFKVYNLLGKVVLSKTVKSEKGLNTIDLDAASFTSGIYMYSIKNGDKTITRRMIVSK
jgi:hypothetical protein